MLQKIMWRTTITFIPASQCTMKSYRKFAGQYHSLYSEATTATAFKFSENKWMANQVVRGNNTAHSIPSLTWGLQTFLQWISRRQFTIRTQWVLHRHSNCPYTSISVMNKMFYLCLGADGDGAPKNHVAATTFIPTFSMYNRKLRIFTGHPHSLYYEATTLAFEIQTSEILSRWQTRRC